MNVPHCDLSLLKNEFASLSEVTLKSWGSRSKLESLMQPPPLLSKKERDYQTCEAEDGRRGLFIGKKEKLKQMLKENIKSCKFQVEQHCDKLKVLILKLYK